MAFTVRNQRQVSWLKQTAGRPFYLKKASACRYHVQHQAVLHRRNGHRKRRAELRPAVEGAAHTQEVKGFADRVGYDWQLNLQCSLWGFWIHVEEYASLKPNHPELLDEQSIK